jgi:hypothetical protein
VVTGMSELFPGTVRGTKGTRGVVWAPAEDGGSSHEWECYHGHLHEVDALSCAMTEIRRRQAERRDRLTWEAGQYGTQRGKAGGISLFGLHWRTQRNKPNYTLKCELPGLTHTAEEHDDAEYLKGKAEEILAGWLALVNGETQ